MPRQFRSFRRYARRNYTRSRRNYTLSSRNIYANRSARAQASQIAAIRNRVNKVFRACKPEKKVAIESSPGQFVMGSGATYQTYLNLGSLNIVSGSGDAYRVGDKIFRKDTYYITLEYFNNSESGYHDGESSGTPIRFLVGRWKDLKSYSNTPALDTLISNYGATGANSTNSVIAPLVNGVTEKNYIYSDFVRYITSAKNQLVVKLSTPWYPCRFAVDSGDSDHSWIIIKAGGLHWDANFTENIQVTYTRKTVFTDA